MLAVCVALQMKTLFACDSASGCACLRWDSGERFRAAGLSVQGVGGGNRGCVSGSTGVGRPSHVREGRCRANVAHIRQSRPDSGLGFEVNVT